MKKFPILAAVLLSLHPGAEASACIHGMTPKIDPTAAQVAEAERLVDNGNPKDAAAWINQANPQFAKGVVGASPLGDRALSVLARAVVRSNGELSGGAAASPNQESRSQALAWSVTALRELHQKHSSEPVYATYLGEALAAQPSTRVEAERLLGDLAKKDILGSPHAYAALAQVYGARGEGAPAAAAAPLAALATGLRELAAHRCERMAKDKGLCTGAPAAPAKPNRGVLAAIEKENARRPGHKSIM